MNTLSNICTSHFVDTIMTAQPSGAVFPAASTLTVEEFDRVAMRSL